MAELEWTSIFQQNAAILKQEDSWRLEFDDSLVCKSPNHGWKEYIKNISARFKCSRCGRGWPSNRVMVVFHMRLTGGQGVVKVKRFRQNCKRCSEAPMEKPSITTDNIHILMENLVTKIRIKCYNEYLGNNDRPLPNLNVNSPHEPAHCEACQHGICQSN